jgi:replicative DNA helicase
MNNKVKEYLSYNISVIPTQENKRPAVNNWETFQNKKLTIDEVDTLYNNSKIRLEIEKVVTKKDGTTFVSKGIKLTDPTGLAIICGSVSGSLEVIDVDTKYCLKGTLWNDLKKLIEDKLPEVYKSLVIATTVNGGYHLYYRCDKIGGNDKLANRYTTDTEKKKDKEGAVKVLIETRGEGGYVVAPPTKGYNFIQGDLSNIKTITTEEREILFNIAKSFNEVTTTETKDKTNFNINSESKTTGLSPFEDYDNRGDVVGLLESKGWRVVNKTGSRINLLRPGKTDTTTSGNFHTDKRTLMIFSSSTDFTPNKGYKGAKVFTILECNGDTKEAYKKLLSLGYGEPYNNGYTDRLFKTEVINVNYVNRVTSQNYNIATAGESINLHILKQTIGEEIIITSPGTEATAEVVGAIDFIHSINKRIYVIENGDTIRGYKYKLNYIFTKYNTIQSSKGSLSDRDVDNLLIEVIELSANLEPTDKDILLKEFLDLDTIQRLGITKESIDVTVDKITTNRDKELQAKEFKRLLSEATQLQDKGDIAKALDLITDKINEVKLKDKKNNFLNLLLPTSEMLIKTEESETPEDLKTNYTINGEEFLLPGGAITVIAACTGHGKTIMAINTVLNVAMNYPTKKFIFFTYEERANSIIQYFLNTYINLDLNNSTSPKSNRRIIKDYFKTGTTQYISRDKMDYFEKQKTEFFKTYIETGRIIIKYIDFKAEDLNTAIDFLHTENNEIGGVFIDYFQLINLSGKTKGQEKINNRQEELKAICKSLNITATKTGLPIILGAQFNREVSNLIDLHATKIREAADIEQIVTTLIALWNIGKKDVNKETSKGELNEINKRTGGAESGIYIELLKSRDLPTGSYEVLDYNGNTGKIKNSENKKSYL